MDTARVTESLRVVSVPVSFTVVAVLTVVAEKDNPLRVRGRREGDRSRARVTVTKNLRIRRPVLRDMPVIREAFPAKGRVDLGDILTPPRAIHSEESVRPRSETERRINDDYSASLFFGSGSESPTVYEIDIVCGKGRAARDADDRSPTAK